MCIRERVPYEITDYKKGGASKGPIPVAVSLACSMALGTKPYWMACPTALCPSRSVSRVFANEIISDRAASRFFLWRLASSILPIRLEESAPHEGGWKQTDTINRGNEVWRGWMPLPCALSNQANVLRVEIANKKIVANRPII